MGRVAAIVAAAIAGIASLPALLGSGAPPPVPPDVGLTPAPASLDPPAAFPPPNPAPKANPHGSGEFLRHIRKKPKMAATRSQHLEHRPSKHGQTTQGTHSSLVSPAPVYAVPPPPTAEHFGFEG